MGERAYPGDISPSNSDKTAFSPSSVSNAATSACRSSFSTGPSCSASLGEAEAVAGEAEARLMRARFQSSASVAGISESPSGAHDRSPMRNAWKHTPRSCSVPRSHRNRWSEHFKEAAVFICISTRSKRRTVSTTNTCRIYMGALQRLRKGKRCFIIEPDESHVQGAVLTGIP